jgi:AcrR family transcriptional regulator
MGKSSDSRDRRRRRTPPRRRRLAYETTRERILSAAADVFQHGYHARSLDEVAARLGVTKPAIYHYFPSKEHLLCELYERVVDLSVARMEAVFNADTAPAEKLEAMVRTHILLCVGQLPLFTVFFREEPSLPDTFRQRVRPKQRAYGRMFVDVYRRGVADGIFRDMDAVVVVSALVGMGNWLHHWYRPDGRLSEKEIADGMVTIALLGCVRETWHARRHTRPAVAPHARRRRSGKEE